MSEGRDIYHEPKQKVLLRTADVYQTEVDDEVAGYSDKLLGHCGRLPQRRSPRGDERPGDGR